MSTKYVFLVVFGGLCLVAVHYFGFIWLPHHRNPVMGQEELNYGPFGFGLAIMVDFLFTAITYRIVQVSEAEKGQRVSKTKT